MRTDRKKTMNSHPCSSATVRRRFLCAALAVLAAGTVMAQTEPVTDPSESAPRILIDRTMGQRPVRLVSISPNTIEVTDQDGRVLSLARSQVLALVPPLPELEQAVIDERVLNSKLPEAERVRPLGRLDLVDGQSLPGTLASAEKPQPDHI